MGFTFAAPLASFGAIAVGESRPSWDRPAKSAALGLVAGALGLDRSDADAHRALAEGYLFPARGEDLPVRALGRLTVDTEGGNHAERREQIWGAESRRGRS